MEKQCSAFAYASTSVSGIPPWGAVVVLLFDFHLFCLFLVYTLVPARTLRNAIQGKGGRDLYILLYDEIVELFSD